VGLVLRARSSGLTFVLIRYSLFLFGLVSFFIKAVGSGPTASHFLIRFAHPTGRPSGAALTTLCNSKKSNQKCRKLNHDGCIS
jgi:hypothetical protein